MTKDEELAFWKAEAERWREVAYAQAQAVIRTATAAENATKKTKKGRKR